MSLEFLQRLVYAKQRNQDARSIVSTEFDLTHIHMEMSQDPLLAIAISIHPLVVWISDIPALVRKS